MPHRRTASLAALFAAAVAATALTGAAPTAAGEGRTGPAGEPGARSASAAPAAAGPGDVCFYTQTHYNGASWCYRPAGYANVPDHIHDKARSFESNADVTVYALDFAGARCYYRAIWTGDRSTDWDWGRRIDGVATDKRGCEAS